MPISLNKFFYSFAVFYFISASLFLAQPANDDLADAILIDTVPFEHIFAGMGISFENDESNPSCTFQDSLPSVWYQYIPSQDGSASFHTGNPSTDCVISAWIGENHPLTEVDCDDDNGTDGEDQIVFPVTSGQTYYICLSGNLSNSVGRFYHNYGPPDPFPVELISFTASAESDKIKLSWRTETEINNYGFEIERKNPALIPIQRGDNDDWEKIGFVYGFGNSNSPNNYAYVDHRVFPGNQYKYRLKQIDNDGSFSYSNIIEAGLEILVDFELFQNYPNPFNPSTQIKFALPKKDHVRVTLYNLIGQRITILADDFYDAGIHEIQFDASAIKNGLSSGVYFYQMEVAGECKSVRKMLLAK